MQCGVCILLLLLLPLYCCLFKSKLDWQKKKKSKIKILGFTFQTRCSLGCISYSVDEYKLHYQYSSLMMCSPSHSRSKWSLTAHSVRILPDTRLHVTHPWWHATNWIYPVAAIWVILNLIHLNSHREALTHHVQGCREASWSWVSTVSSFPVRPESGTRGGQTSAAHVDGGRF